MKPIQLERQLACGQGLSNQKGLWDWYYHLSVWSGLPGKSQVSQIEMCGGKSEWLFGFLVTSSLLCFHNVVWSASKFWKVWNLGWKLSPDQPVSIWGKLGSQSDKQRYQIDKPFIFLALLCRAWISLNRLCDRTTMDIKNTPLTWKLVRVESDSENSPFCFSCLPV